MEQGRRVPEKRDSVNTTGRPPRRRFRGERGSVLVEAAFITPVLFFLMFSVLEFGLAFRDYLALANTTRDGARTASVYGRDPSTDYQILQSISSASNVISRNDVERIVVYKGTGPNSVVPTACKTSSEGISGVCNVYTSNALGLAETEFGCRSDRTLDKYWCPTARVVTAAGPPDYVGVWVKVNHRWVTGLFGSTVSFKDSTVMRMEPQRQV